MKMHSPAPQASAPASDTAKPRIVKTGKGKAGNYDCVKYDAFEGKTKVAEACFASAGELDMSKEDYDAIKAMFGQRRKMQEKASAMAGEYGGDDHEPGFIGDEVDGLPVATMNIKSGEETVVANVSNGKLAKDLFKIPDYPMMEMPGAPEM
jgi:hypothetical protein